MQELITHRDKVIKHHVVSVPQNIKLAKVELLIFRGAPAFIGTMLARLHFENSKSIILYSKMSGVVNRILVENDETVSCGQRLFELRNTNITRIKSGQKMRSSNLATLKPSRYFFGVKKDQCTEDICSLPTDVSRPLRIKS